MSLGLRESLTRHLLDVRVLLVDDLGHLLHQVLAVAQAQTGQVTHFPDALDLPLRSDATDDVQGHRLDELDHLLLDGSEPKDFVLVFGVRLTDALVLALQKAPVVGVLLSGVVDALLSVIESRVVGLGQRFLDLVHDVPTQGEGERQADLHAVVREGGDDALNRDLRHDDSSLRENFPLSMF